jgi:hypothetical protein
MWGSYQKKRDGEAVLWFQRCPLTACHYYPAADSHLDLLLSGRC